MLDSIKLLFQIAVALLIADLLKDGIKALGRYAWSYTSTTVRYCVWRLHGHTR